MFVDSAHSESARDALNRESAVHKNRGKQTKNSRGRGRDRDGENKRYILPNFYCFVVLEGEAKEQRELEGGW